MPRPAIAALTIATVLLGGCMNNGPRPVALRPSEPIQRMDAYDLLFEINELHAARLGIPVAELRRRDIVCVMLATGVEIRPGVIAPYADGMLSAIHEDDYIDVRIRSTGGQGGVYAAQGCQLLLVSWGDGTVFETEAAARNYLDRLATAWVTLGGDVTHRARQREQD